MHDQLAGNTFERFKILSLPLAASADLADIRSLFLFLLFLAFHIIIFMQHRLLDFNLIIYLYVFIKKLKGTHHSSESIKEKHQKILKNFFIDNFKIILDEHERNLFFHRIIVDNKDGRSFCRPYTLFLLVSLQTSPKLVLYSFCILLCPLLSFLQLFS